MPSNRTRSTCGCRSTTCCATGCSQPGDARLDPDRGVTFTTYASHCIMGEIRHCLRKEATFACPGCVTGLKNRVNRLVEEAVRKTGVFPSLSEIARRLNVREEGVTQAMQAGWVPLEELDLIPQEKEPKSSFPLIRFKSQLMGESVAPDTGNYGWNQNTNRYIHRSIPSLQVQRLPVRNRREVFFRARA